jgi:hypothetical protein
MRKLLCVALLLAFGTGVNSAACAQGLPTGMFRLEYSTRDVVGPQMAEALSAAIDPGETLEWQVYVPATYDPARAAGVFVFVDPDGWGGMPDEYRALFDRRNMIWIGARRTVLSPKPARLVWKAILAYRAIDKDYAIDLNRLYIGSRGDGAFIAVNALLKANEFAGAIYMNGSYFWGEQSAPELDVARRKHYVFITGTNDQAKVQVRNDYGYYRDDGVQQAKLIYDTKKLADPPQAEHLDEALAFLDSRLNRQPK